MTPLEILRSNWNLQFHSSEENYHRIVMPDGIKSLQFLLGILKRAFSDGRVLKPGCKMLLLRGEEFLFFHALADISLARCVAKWPDCPEKGEFAIDVVRFVRNKPKRELLEMARSFDSINGWPYLQKDLMSIISEYFEKRLGPDAFDL